MAKTENEGSPGLLDPDAVSRGEALGILARLVVEGYRVGEHRSPFQGFAIEFAQHREYAMGDDPRHLDWKVIGRTDRYYIKQYRQDTNFVAHVILDASESMDYGSGKITKMHYGKALAACLSYLVLKQRDASAVALIDDEIREYMPRTDNLGKIHHIMDRLAAYPPKQKTKLGQCLLDVARMIKRKGITILISDLLDDEETLQQGIQRIRFAGSEVIVFHVMDPAELTFPFRGTVKFIGLEETGVLETAPADIAKSFRQEVEAFCGRVREICERNGCHYVLANTATPLAETLSGYLVFRKKSVA